MFIIDFLKSVYFNLRYLPFKQAIYLPIWVTTNLKDCKLKRGQLILKQPYCKSIFLGACGSPGLQQYNSGLYLDEGAKLIFHGMTVISEGSVLRCDKDSIIEFGKNFYCNKNCFMRSSDRIVFGDECSLGWNVQLNTNDGHIVKHNGKDVSQIRSIIVGNHVWLTSNTIVCKNVIIAEGSIVAQGAVVTKSITETKAMIGGVPAKVIGHNVEWQK